METTIAVRFYENKKYGTTFGKGLYRHAVYNATADVSQPKTKYLLDMFSFSDWTNTAKTDSDMNALAMAEDLIGTASKAELLATWVKRLDNDGSKPRVSGFGVLNMDTQQLSLLINDAEKGVEQAWQLTARTCKQASLNQKSPQLLATNADLN